MVVQVVQDVAEAQLWCGFQLSAMVVQIEGLCVSYPKREGLTFSVCSLCWLHGYVQRNERNMPLVKGQTHSGSFKKGNTFGRKSTTVRFGPNGETLAHMARKHTAEALNVVVSVAMGKDPDTGESADHPIRDRVYAAESVLNRGWGRAPQAIDLNISDKHDAAALTREVLLSIAAGAVIEGELADDHQNEVEVDTPETPAAPDAVTADQGAG